MVVDAGCDGVTGYKHLDQGGGNRASVLGFSEGDVMGEKVRYVSFRNDFPK